MVILGIDPGYAIVGWGVVEYSHSKFRVLGYGAITTEATAPFPERLQIIYNDMCYLFDKYKPEAMSMEKLFYNSNQKTVIDVAQARGVITLAAQMYGKDIFEYTPLQVKQSVTGYGRAEKKQVMEMTKSNAVLKLEVSKLEAPVRIQKIAELNLGMRLPAHALYGHEDGVEVRQG